MADLIPLGLWTILLGSKPSLGERHVLRIITFTITIVYVAKLEVKGCVGLPFTSKVGGAV